MLALTGISSFCQPSYPKKITIDSDTLIAITPVQLLKINRTIARAEYLRDENSILRQELIVADSINTSLERIVVLKDAVIQDTNRKLDYAENINKDFQRTFQEQRKKNLRTTIGVGVGGTLFGILAGLLLVK